MLLAASAALLVAFLVIETRVEAPLLPLRIFKLKTVAGANAVAFLLGASFFAFIFVGTLYMQQVLGYSAIQTGIAWAVASMTSVALAGLSQVLVTRISAKLVMAFGMLLIGGGILWTAAAPVDGHFWSDLVGPFLIVGAGTAFAFIPVSIAALAGIRRRTQASPRDCSTRRSRSEAQSASQSPRPSRPRTRPRSRTAAPTSATR